MSRIDDGFSTTIEFGLTKLYEKTVTPPGVEGGGETPTTTMLNTTWRTRSPKKLKTLSPCSFVAAYDPAVYDEIVAEINTNQSIVITFADSSTLTFWGWLDSFLPNEAEEGVQPTANCVIIPSNQNVAGVETAPQYAAGS